jgi:hypothetical protein
MLKSSDKLAWTILAFTWGMSAAISQAEVARPVSCVQKVVSALARTGIVIGPDQIEFLAGTDNAKETAKIRVVSVGPSSSGAAKVKLRCQDNHQCLPFYVLVRGLEGVKVGSSAPVAPAIPTASPEHMIHGGDHAILVLESSDSRMRFPVICLQSGVLGQHIRAASTDRRQFYEAEVVAPGMLKGRL